VTNSTAVFSPLPPGFIVPCLPTASDRCKNGLAWVHEIKHDGYRMIAGAMVIASGPIRAAGLIGPSGIRALWRHCALSGCARASSTARRCGAGRTAGPISRSCIRGLRRDVFLYAFDLIELNGEDLRPMPLERRKGKLEKPLARSEGIRFSEHMDGDGAICPTAPVDRGRGSRSRIRRAPLCCGSRTGRGQGCSIGLLPWSAYRG
jgi:bifunctional non-homologous end joining protein LigD